MSEMRLRVILLSLLITIATIFLIGTIWSVLQFFSGVLILFFSAWLISFIFSPVANWLHARRVPRLLAVAIVYLTVALILTGGIILAIPILNDQVRQVIGRIRELATPNHLQQLHDAVLQKLRDLGFNDRDARNIIDQFTSSVQNGLQSITTSILTKSTDVLASIATILLDIAIVLILSFYMMLDGRRVMDRQIDRLPTNWQKEVRSFESEVSRIFGGFIRGQLIIGLVYGLLTFLALVVLQVPNGFLISMMSGLIMIIPFAGPPLSMIPPLALTVLEVSAPDLSRTALLLFILLFIAQQLALQVLAPRILSYSLGQHPIWLFAALLIGARVSGAWGAFFAPPFAALIIVIITQAYERWAKRSPLFAPDDATKPAPIPPAESAVAAELAPARLTQSDPPLTAQSGVPDSEDQA